MKLRRQRASGATWTAQTSNTPLAVISIDSFDGISAVATTGLGSSQ